MTTITLRRCAQRVNYGLKENSATKQPVDRTRDIIQYKCMTTIKDSGDSGKNAQDKSMI